MAASKLAAEERKLIEDRLGELDTLGREQDLLCKDQEIVKKEICGKKVEIQAKLGTVQFSIEKCEANISSLKDQQTRKKTAFDDQLADFGKKKSGIKLKISDLQQKIAVKEKNSTQATYISECTVCIESLLPPKQILQCKEGHLICNSCQDELPTPDKCPTCNFVGFFSRNRALEDLCRAVPDQKKLSMKEKLAAMSLAVGEIEVLNEEIEIFSKKVDSIDIQIVETRKSLEKDELDYEEKVSVFVKELTSLRLEEFDLQSKLDTLESELAALARDFNSKMAAIVGQQDDFELIRKRDFEKLKAEKAQLERHLADIQNVTKMLDQALKEYPRPTHLVKLQVEIDGEPIPDIHILLFGKESPHTVGKFLHLCEGQYLGSKIDYVERENWITGGMLSAANKVELLYFKYTSDSPYTDWRVGDLQMKHSPEPGTWWNSWFGFHLGGDDWGSKVVRVGRVLDTSPGSGLREMERRAKCDRYHTVTNEIRIKNIISSELSGPVLVHL